MAIYSFLNPVLNPLLGLPPLLSIFIVSGLMALLITLINKFATNQTLMKDIRTRQKSLNKRMKEAKSDPDKLAKIQKESMELSGKQMKGSLKSMIFTFVPAILIFGWLSAHIAYYPLVPDQPFEVSLQFQEFVDGDVSLNVDGESVGLSKPIQDSRVSFKLKLGEGDHVLTYDLDGEPMPGEVYTDVFITSENRYAPVESSYKNQPVSKITLSNEKIIPIPISQNHLGWLGTYIIFSIAFSFGFRKLLKVY